MKHEIIIILTFIHNKTHKIWVKMGAKEFNIRGYKKEVNLIKTQQFIDKTKAAILQ